MTILLNFILSISLFIYGMQLFSSSFENIQEKIKNILKSCTNSPKRGIILGTIITAIIQSSSIITVITVGLVNSNIITFHDSIGIIMGANLGTCITSWITSFLTFEGNTLTIFNPNTYIPFILLIGLILHFKDKRKFSNILIGFALFLLGLSMMQTSLEPIMKYKRFKDLINYLNNPLLGLLIGIIITCLVQSSSATVALLQTISNKQKLTYYMTIPIILGENIGSCITTLISCIGTNSNAKKVAYAHLFYNIIGTIIFIIIFYLGSFLNINALKLEVNSNSIALIHTIFNFLSIIIFYPFLNMFEKFIIKISNISKKARLYP